MKKRLLSISAFLVILFLFSPLLTIVSAAPPASDAAICTKLGINPTSMTVTNPAVLKGYGLDVEEGDAVKLLGMTRTTITIKVLRTGQTAGVPMPEA
jgi:hypothetical protein